MSAVVVGLGAVGVTVAAVGAAFALGGARRPPEGLVRLVERMLAAGDEGRVRGLLQADPSLTGLLSLMDARGESADLQVACGNLVVGVALAAVGWLGMAPSPWVAGGALVLYGALLAHHGACLLGLGNGDDRADVVLALTAVLASRG